MVAITALKPEDIVYSVSSRKQGNTNIRRKAVHLVKVIEVAEDHRYVIASWNGNEPKRFYPSEVSKWRRTPPPKE